MRHFVKVKKISKFLIWFSLAAVMISAGGTLILKNRIGADEFTPVIPDELPDYRRIEASGGTMTIIMGNVSSASITGFNYASSSILDRNFGIYRLAGDDCGNIEKNDGDVCYALNSGMGWDRPSVIDPIRPTWDFLNEAYRKASAVSDQDTVDWLSAAKIAYVGAAFRAWPGSNIFTLENSPGTVTIATKEFFEIDEVEQKLTSDDPYIRLSDSGNPDYPRVLSLTLTDNYNLASDNSLWQDGIRFLLNSVVPAEQNFGIDLSSQITYLTNTLEVYNQFAAANSSQNTAVGENKILSINGPGKIVLNADGSATMSVPFTAKIDQNVFPTPTSGYKTEIYLKPDAAKGEGDPYIKLLTSSNTTVPFYWDQVLSGQYIKNGAAFTPDTNMQNNGTAIYYDKKFPQKYYVHAITYNSDGSTHKDDAYFTFETSSTALASGTTNTETSNFANGSLAITAPSVSAASTPVPVVVRATDNNNPKLINKVVVWVCRGDSSVTIAGDSSNCQEPGSTNELVKKEFLQLTYNGNSASMNFDWDVSGTATGTYSLMAKAYNVAADGTVTPVGTKVATTVNISNSSVVGAGTTPTYLTGRISTGPKATSNPRGSKITSVTGLVNKIIGYLIYLIGALSVIAIIVGGIQFISSGGDNSKAEKGKKTIVYAVYGIVIATLAYVLEMVVVDIIKRIVG